MTTDNKFDYLSKLSVMSSLTQLQKNTIMQLCQDEDAEIRMRTAEILAFFPSPETESMLFLLIKDNNYMVRASACNSLSFYCTKHTIEVLMKATRDKTALVRGYAVLSLADVELDSNKNKTEIVDYLKTLLTKESSEWVKISIYRSLVLLGEISYYSSFLKQLDNKQYRNRCFVLNLLKELLENKIVYFTDELRFVLQERYSIEKTIAVKQNLKTFLNTD